MLLPLMGQHCHTTKRPLTCTNIGAFVSEYYGCIASKVAADACVNLSALENTHCSAPILRKYQQVVSCSNPHGRCIRDELTLAVFASKLQSTHCPICVPADIIQIAPPCVAKAIPYGLMG